MNGGGIVVDFGNYKAMENSNERILAWISNDKAGDGASNCGGQREQHEETGGSPACAGQPEPYLQHASWGTWA